MTKHPPIKDQFYYLFSSSELIISYLLLLYTLFTFNIYTGLIVVILFFKIIFLNLMKNLMKGTRYSLRPKDAFNCSMFNNGGKSITSGLPSGHMFFIGMLIFIVFNVYQKHKNMNIFILYFILIITTMIGRIYTNCHTLIQCIAGLILGLIFGMIIYHIDLSIEGRYKLYQKHRNVFYNIFKCLSDK